MTVAGPRRLVTGDGGGSQAMRGDESLAATGETSSPVVACHRPSSP
jgi:hypothetical protein